LFGCD